MTALKQKRLACGYSTQSIAAALKISVQRYSNYETGRRTPPPEMIKPFAEALNISTDELVALIAESQRQLVTR